MPKGKTPRRNQSQVRYVPGTGNNKISPGMLLKSPVWMTASRDMFTEPMGTPSPFKNRVLTRRSSVYVRKVKSGTGMLKSPKFKVPKNVGGKKEVLSKTKEIISSTHLKSTKVVREESATQKPSRAIQGRVNTRKMPSKLGSRKIVSQTKVTSEKRVITIRNQSASPDHNRKPISSSPDSHKKPSRVSRSQKIVKHKNNTKSPKPVRQTRSKAVSPSNAKDTNLKIDEEISFSIKASTEEQLWKVHQTVESIKKVQSSKSRSTSSSPKKETQLAKSAKEKRSSSNRRKRSLSQSKSSSESRMERSTRSINRGATKRSRSTTPKLKKSINNKQESVSTPEKKSSKLEKKSSSKVSRSEKSTRSQSSNKTPSVKPLPSKRDSSQQKKSPLKSVKKLVSPRILLVKTPFTVTERKKVIKATSGKKVKSPKSPVKVVLSATEMKLLLDEATDDESGSSPPATKKQKVQGSAKAVKSRSPKSPAFQKISGRRNTPARVKDSSVKSPKPKSDHLKIKLATPRTPRGLTPKVKTASSHAKKTPQSRSTPVLTKKMSPKNITKTRSTPVIVKNTIAMEKSVILSKSESVHLIASPRPALRKKSQSFYETPAESSRLSRKSVKIIASEITRSPIIRQLTPARPKGKSNVSTFQMMSAKKDITKDLAQSKSVSSVTPIKAARVLGKISYSAKSVSNLSLDPPRTSTPAGSTVKKRPAVMAPPVSEIRQSKRMKKQMLSEDSTLFTTTINKDNFVTGDTLNMAVAQSQVVSSAIEEVSENESHLELDENNAGWRCNIM